jgi:hypothetical protein
MSPTILQLHWQNPKELKETIFVSQGQFPSEEEFQNWVTELIERRRGEIPDGWAAMVCTESSPFFVKAAK